MQRYEYKAVPAPRKGEKARGVKTTEDRFALALTHAINAMAKDGWEYLRTDSLPCEERVGFTGKTTVFQTVMVFRRAVPGAVAETPPSAAPEMRQRPATAAQPGHAADSGEADDQVEAVADVPQADPLDEAARRAGVAPPVARPIFGTAPRLVPVPDTPVKAPGLGPARGGAE